MASLQDIIRLAKADGGKFFVMDERGEVQLVMMGVEEYQRLLLTKLQRRIVDVENVNREILRAQLHEEAPIPQAPGPIPKGQAPMNIPFMETQPVRETQSSPPAVRPRGNNPPEDTRTPSQPEHARRADLREEVIDPSFDFEAPRLDLEDI